MYYGKTSNLALDGICTHQRQKATLHGSVFTYSTTEQLIKVIMLYSPHLDLFV